MTTGTASASLFRASLAALAIQASTCFLLQASPQAQTALFMKNNDRAFLEKQLEDMMDNDWRVFRARLVAHERLDQEQETSLRTAAAQEEADAKLAKQGQLGEMFAGAISSIFSLKSPAATTTTAPREDAVFKGDTIGMLLEDPFVTEDELPVHIQRKVSIDKHRWAHLIPHVEPGCILLANEKLGGVFHQTVVLVVEHSESQGSIGVIINR